MKNCLVVFVCYNLGFITRRIPTVKKSDKVDDVDPVQPVYVGEVPQVVRDEQANMLQKRVSGQYTWFPILRETIMLFHEMSRSPHFDR